MLTLDPLVRPLYPFANNAKNYVRVGEGYYMHLVDEGAGEAVLFLHGNPTWSFLYRNLIIKLRERFRCIAPDHLGCGFSDKPQRHPYRLKNHVDHIHQLVQSLELKRVHLVLHDWGGPIGLLWAMGRPERVGKIVLLNTGAFAQGWTLPWQIALCRQPLWGPLLVRGLGAFSKGLMRQGVVQPLEPKVVQGYCCPYGSWAQRVGIWGFLRDIPVTERHPSFPFLAQLDKGLALFKKHPMLLCWGMKDFCFTGAILQRFCERFPHADVRTYADAGHLVLEDAGADALGVIEGFLLEA